MSEPEKLCDICLLPRSGGIYLLDAFICDECQQEMVHTEVEEERYRYFVQQLKRIWLKQEA